MPTFADGVPIETTEPFITVDASAQNPFKVGKLIFSLVVVDDSGNESGQSTFTVNVIDSERPTAILTGPDKVPQTQSFKLDGSRSTDVGGRIVRYRWTLVRREA
ncbi:hypothetical protein [Longimicrobium sp.]|uniref:hypothetical protein n=1 Tax=Longimicrobium sp. TaxID=2029185 RepID=UPI002E35F547|nr:hypothetical protein [Longimicrobium sp.]HEX6042059.1 hypothetical protein [Longimicrobium sp.]